MAKGDPGGRTWCPLCGAELRVGPCNPGTRRKVSTHSRLRQKVLKHFCQLRRHAGLSDRDRTELADVAVDEEYIAKLERLTPGLVVP